MKLFISSYVLVEELVEVQEQQTYTHWLCWQH